MNESRRAPVHSKDLNHDSPDEAFDGQGTVPHRGLTSPGSGLDAGNVKHGFHPILTVLGAFALSFVGFFCWGTINFESRADALKYLQGRRLLVEPSIISVGEGMNGDHKEATFRVRNLSSSKVTILGSKSTCSCVSVEDLPIAIEGGKDHLFHVNMLLEGKPSAKLSQTITYNTDCTALTKFHIQVNGSIADRQ